MPEQELFDRKSRKTTSASKHSGMVQPAFQSAANANLALQRVHDAGAGLGSTDIMVLQRTVGNQAVLRMLDQRRATMQPQHGELLTQSDSHLPTKSTKPTVQRTAQESAFGTEAISEAIPIAPVTTHQSTPHIMRAVSNAPQPKVTSYTKSNSIQRAGNWSKFKNFFKGQKEGFKDDQQWWMDEMNPANNKGVGKVAKPLLASPFAALQMGLSGVGRGLATMGAGAYYGGKGMASGVSSLASSAKAAYNKDRNPHGYDRNRLPTRGGAAMQGGKPLGAMALSAGTAGATTAPTNFGGGVSGGVGMLNVLSTADSAMTWSRGSKLREQAKQRGDIAGEKVGTRTVNQGQWGVAGGLAGTVSGGMNLGAAIQHGSSGLMGFNNLATGASYTSSALGVAGAGAGIVGGSITAGQGLWKVGKAASKLWKLSKSAPMLTPEGESWKKHIKNKQQAKLGANSLKTIGGILGITAGALIIASNPVGWALGIASAATVGGLMAYKLWNKYKKSKRKQKAKADVREQMQQEQEEARNLEDVENDNGGGIQEAGVQGQDEAGMQNADPTTLDEAKRKQAVELGNRVAQVSSKSGKIAGEIRSALGQRHDPMYATLIDSLEHKIPDHAYFRAHYKDPGCPVPTYALRVHDAVVLLNTLNVTPEQAESESGQELIEKKLSVSESL